MLDFFIPSGERDSISVRMMELFSMPAIVAEVPVGDTKIITVEMRLLDDLEMEDAMKHAARYVGAAHTLVIRRAVLSRAVQRIDNESLVMPESFCTTFKAETGRAPTDLEQRYWVFSHCQSVVLQMLMDKYNELLDEQSRQVLELKKKLEEQSEAFPDETLSSLRSQESSEASSTGPPSEESTQAS